MTQLQLKSLLHYNPLTGIFTWLYTNKITANPNTSSRYCKIRIDYKLYQAHRLAWLYIYGYLPKEIDHINHDKKDNRIVNLREVTRSENMRNKPRISTNTSGACGVIWNKRNKKWNAQIAWRVNGKIVNKWLGTFKNKEDAIIARKEANIKYGFHKLHGE